MAKPEVAFWRPMLWVNSFLFDLFLIKSTLTILQHFLKETANTMSFEYRFISEGSEALKEIICFRSLKEINCIFLIKTHDIRFIIYYKK